MALRMPGFTSHSIGLNSVVGETDQQRLRLHDAGSVLEAGPGELIVLTGESGSGKSAWLKRIAGLLAAPAGTDIQMPCAAPVVRMLFDRWPCIWLGQSVEEELLFGLRDSVSTDTLKATLLLWGLSEGLRCNDPQTLPRLQSIRLSLAAMTLAKPDILLLDNPSASLSSGDAMRLSEDIARWLKGSNTIVVVASNRWQDWHTVLTQRWCVKSLDCVPEIVKD